MVGEASSTLTCCGGDFILRNLHANLKSLKLLIRNLADLSGTWHVDHTEAHTERATAGQFHPLPVVYNHAHSFVFPVAAFTLWTFKRHHKAHKV